MILTIRGRLTFWYMLAFAAALTLVLGVFALEMKRQFDGDLRRALRTEEAWITDLFDEEFLPLLTAEAADYDTLAAELLEELDERYGMKHEFVILAVARSAGPVVFSGGLKNAEALLPVDFLERRAGNYDVLLNAHRYRVRVFHRAWGRVAAGLENETIFEIAKEAGKLLIWIIPLGVLLAVAGGWLLARLAMRPVLAAARAAESISVVNLHARLPAYAGKDEFGALVSTLNHMIARLEADVTRLQQFTQDAAHELRTPLTILRGDLELAYQDEKTSEETRGLLQKTLDRVIALGQITDNLMLLTRSDSGDYPIDKKLFRFDFVVQEIFEDIKILAEARGLAALVHECSAVEFWGDEPLIRRVLMNLCDNALKYTRSGNLELRLHRSERAVEVLVSDTGIGIPAEDLPNIFDRFYRVDKSRASATGGSGLGLAICKWIVEAHGGEIAITSEVGVGTTVRVSLPLTATAKIL